MHAKEIILQIAATVIAHKDQLTDLDRAIGDGDHGINMARGFESVTAKLSPLADDTAPAEILKTVGVCLMSTVGGASGPLYGTAFIRLAEVAKNGFSPDNVEIMFDAVIKGIKDRGKAEKGDKTMLDALLPAKEAFAEALRGGSSLYEALHAAALGAQAGSERTKNLLARKGRASYLGERSIGHIDPGAASSALILQTLDKFVASVRG